MEGLGTETSHSGAGLGPRHPQKEKTFVGHPTRRDGKGQHAHGPLHAGIISINGPVEMDLECQRRLFEKVLMGLDNHGDLSCQVSEAVLDSDELGIDLIDDRMPPAGTVWMPRQSVARAPKIIGSAPPPAGGANLYGY